jgi:hypothetical protein
MSSLPNKINKLFKIWLGLGLVADLVLSILEFIFRSAIWRYDQDQPLFKRSESVRQV